MDAQNKSDQILKDRQALEKYVEQLIKDKNSPYVNEKNHKEIKEMLLKDVGDAINRKMVAELTNQQVDELNKLLDRNATDEELNSFFGKNISNIETIITEALIDFRKGYLSVVYKPNEKKEEELLPAPPVPADKTVD